MRPLLPQWLTAWQTNKQKTAFCLLGATAVHFSPAAGAVVAQTWGWQPSASPCAAHQAALPDATMQFITTPKHQHLSIKTQSSN
jgi:hypothetical protein